ncbi:HTH-type transcriptional regulator YiaJ [compost metagenome]
MLALLPPDELDRRYPDRNLTPVTAHTITDWNEFTAALAEIRSSGYSVDQEEIIQGICCAAAPVLDASGNAVAAVSTSMLRHAYLDKQETALQEVIRLGKKLSLT